MAKLSQKQIALLWIAEGGNPAKADEASAVAMAESGGDSKIHTPGSCCYGLYQFNVEVGSATLACATNAVCSTRAAIKLSENGTQWEGGRWEAHENGAYRQFLGKSGVGDGSKAAHLRGHTKNVDIETPFGTIPAPGPNIDPTNPLNNVPGLPNLPSLGGIDLTDPLKSIKAISAFFLGAGELLLTPEGWARLGKLIGGAIMLMWGLRIVVRESTGTDPVAGAKKVAETAAIVATVK